MARPEPRKDAVVERFKTRLPRTLAHGQDGAVVELKDGVLNVELAAQGRTTAEFFPIDVPGLKYGTAEIKVESDRVLIKVPVEVNMNNAGGNPIVVKGLAALGQSLDDLSYQFEFPLPAS
jgi:HSP20 family molecular chaperone IbpA